MRADGSLGPSLCRSVKRLAVMVLVALSITTAEGDAEERKSGRTDEELAALRQAFQARLDHIGKEKGFPGATAAFILPDGTCAGFATGLADKEKQIRMAVDARMLAASVGKTFVAAVAVGLAHEGKLGLDDKIEKWLGKEDWFARLPNGRDITLRMLLRHSGGLRHHFDEPRFGAEVLLRRMAKKPDLDYRFPPERLVGFVLDKELLFPAGKGYSYTDAGYLLVGMIIERASGSAYYDLLRRRFLDPFGLRLTIPSDRRKIPGLCPGYLDPKESFGLPGKTVVDGLMVYNPATEWTGGGIASNPQDLVRWAKVLYEGKALKKPYLSELLDGMPCGRSGKRRYGLGVFIQETPLGTTYGHDGSFPGYNTELIYFPAHKVAISVQVNTDINTEIGACALDLAGVVLRKRGHSTFPAPPTEK